MIQQIRVDVSQQAPAEEHTKMENMCSKDAGVPRPDLCLFVGAKFVPGQRRLRDEVQA